jgi:hypothetical protein
LRIFIYLVALALISGCAAHQANVADSIVINEKSQQFEFTVPQSQLVMSLPKNDFMLSANKNGRATESPRYFYLQNEAANTIFSGWFEPAERYQALSYSFKQEMAGLKKSGFGDPQGVEATELGQWKIILYYFPIPNGSSVHMRTSYLRAGTWIDLHVSITSEQQVSEAKAALLDLLSSINVTEKTAVTE